MQKSLPHFLLLSILILASCNEQATIQQELSAKMQSKANTLDAYFTALTDLDQFNGVILASQNDTLLLYKAYNLNESLDSSTYITKESQFDIHSVSKLMAHYQLLKLQHQGELSLDQKLVEFYPSYAHGDRITVEMLLNHSSGLPREFEGFEGNKKELSREQIIDMSLQQPLLFEPETGEQYSNTAYELLYDIIAKNSGKSFSQYLVDELFLPLNMEDSGAHFFTKASNTSNLARNHVLKDSQLVAVPNILDEDFRTSRIYSTAYDLHLFLDELQKYPIAGQLQSEKGVIAKDGGSDGIRAQIYLDLENDFQFVLLSNYDGIPFFKTIEDFAKILRNEPVEIPKEINRNSISLEAEFLKRYEGKYLFPDFGELVLQVKVEEEHLVVVQDGEVIAHLQAESETVFFEDPKAAESFEFVANEAGGFDVLMGWKGISVPGQRIP